MFLDNGLKVLVQELHTAPLVSVWCWYRVGSGDELPGRTGVSHWVEHMNFKGTENIPRDEMKGIVERFGGTWNGYTWIDQTTYLETAGNDALDTLLFIEAERMARGLYEPEECESERTVIISELQGGENDPDQLLDTEVTATAFRAHPYRHPTIGWIDDLRSMTPRRSLRPLPPALRSRQRDAGRRRRRRHRRRAAARGEALRRDRRRPAAGARPPRRAARRSASGASLLEREGTTAYLKFAWHAPAADRRGFLSDAGARRRADRREGREHLVAASAARRRSAARGSTRRWSSAGWRRSVAGSLLPTREPFLYSVSLTASDGVPLASLEEAAVARDRSRARARA